MIRCMKNKKKMRVDEIGINVSGEELSRQNGRKYGSEHL